MDSETVHKSAIRIPQSHYATYIKKQVDKEASNRSCLPVGGGRRLQVVFVLCNLQLATCFLPIPHAAHTAAVSHSSLSSVTHALSHWLVEPLRKVFLHVLQHQVGTYLGNGASGDGSV